MRYVMTPLAIAVCSGLGWLVFWAAQHRANRPLPPPKVRTLAVEVIQLQSYDLEDRIELVGSLEPQAQVEIRSRVRGYVTALPFDVGEFVGRDGKLPIVVELENAAAREALNGSLAMLKVAEAQLQAKRAESVLAEKNLERQRSLIKTDATTRGELDRATAEFAIAAAQIELQQAQIALARSEVERHRIALSQTRMAAPFAAFVSERLVDVGDLANPDDPLLNLVDISIVRTVVHLTEQDYERIMIDQAALVEVDALPNQPFTGKVVRKAPVLNPETRTGAVHIEIDNPGYQLKPGMHARVSILADRRRGAQVLPVAAVLDHFERPSVFVVAGEPPRAELRPVQVGLANSDLVEILSGVAGDEQVIALGSHVVEPGQEVTPIAAPPLASASHTRDARHGSATMMGGQ